MFKSEFKIIMSHYSDTDGSPTSEEYVFKFETDEKHNKTFTSALELCLRALKHYGYVFSEEKLIHIIENNICCDELF